MAVSQIKVGAALSYLTTVVSLALGLFYTPWMISVVGRDDYGLYTLAVTFISIFLMDFGIGSGVNRYLSHYYARGEHERASEFLGVVYRLYLVLAAAIAVALLVIYFFIDAIYVSLTPQQLMTFKGLYVVVAAYSVISVPFMSQNNVLIANERFIALKVCTLTQKLVVTGATVAALIMGLGVYALVLITAAGNLVFILVKAMLIRRTPSRPTWGPFDVSLAREFAGYSGWVTVSLVCQRCNYNLMPTVLGVVSGAAQIAMFGLASQLESYLYTIGDSLGSMFMPRVSRILVQEDPESELLGLMVRVGRIQLYTVGTVVAGFIALGLPFVRLWLGQGYDAVWVGAVLLFAPSLVSHPQCIGTTAMTASNNVRHLAYASMAMAVCCTLLGFPLGSMWGGVGGCAAIAIGLSVGIAINNFGYTRLLGIDVSAFLVRTYLPWLLVAAVAVAFGVVICQVAPCVTWLIFFAEVLVFGVVYVVMCWVICFNDYEKALVKRPLDRIVRLLSSDGKPRS